MGPNLGVLAAVLIAASLTGICYAQSVAQPTTFGFKRCPKTAAATIEGFWAAYPGGPLPAPGASPIAYLAITQAESITQAKVAISVNGILTNEPQESVNAAGYFDGCSLNGRSCGKIVVYRAFFAKVTNGPPGGWYTLVVQGNITYSFFGAASEMGRGADGRNAMADG